MNIREAHREIWSRKLVPSIQPPDRQHIDRVQWTAELIQPVDSGRLLDIGTGSGAMLARARTLGYEAIGVDFDPPVIDWLKAQGYAAVCADISSEPLPFDSGFFDVVTACDVIEHLLDPLWLLAETRRVLKSCGLLFISTPNYSHWRRIAGLISGTHQGTSSDEVLLDGGHVAYYGADDLRRLLARCGFNSARVYFRNSDPAPGATIRAWSAWMTNRDWVNYTYQIVSAETN